MAKETMFCPPDTELGYFRAKLQCKGTPEVPFFHLSRSTPHQEPPRKKSVQHQNSQGSWPFMKGTSPLQRDLCSRRKRLLQPSACPHAHVCANLSYQGKSAAKSKREAPRPPPDQDRT